MVLICRALCGVRSALFLFSPSFRFFLFSFCLLFLCFSCSFLPFLFSHPLLLFFFFLRWSGLTAVASIFDTGWLLMMKQSAVGEPNSARDLSLAFCERLSGCLNFTVISCLNVFFISMLNTMATSSKQRLEQKQSEPDSTSNSVWMLVKYVALLVSVVLRICQCRKKTERGSRNGPIFVWLLPSLCPCLFFLFLSV